MKALQINQKRLQLTRVMGGPPGKDGQNGANAFNPKTSKDNIINGGLFVFMVLGYYSFAGLQDGAIVQPDGFYSSGDCETLRYRYNSTEAGQPDGFSIVKIPGLPGALVEIPQATYYLSQFGAVTWPPEPIGTPATTTLGGLWNGGAFPTLAQAQKVFPEATSLDEEITTLALKRALKHATKFVQDRDVFLDKQIIAKPKINFRWSRLGGATVKLKAVADFCLNQNIGAAIALEDSDGLLVDGIKLNGNKAGLKALVGNQDPFGFREDLIICSDVQPYPVSGIWWDIKSRRATVKNCTFEDPFGSSLAFRLVDFAKAENNHFSGADGGSKESHYLNFTRCKNTSHHGNEFDGSAEFNTGPKWADCSSPGYFVHGKHHCLLAGDALCSFNLANGKNWVEITAPVGQVDLYFDSSTWTYNNSENPEFWPIHSDYKGQKLFITSGSQDPLP